MGEKDIETRMAIVSVVVAVTVMIFNMISEETVKFIGQWLIENMVKPVGQLLIEKLVKPIGQWLGYLFHYSSNIENMKEQVKKLRDFRERVPLPHLVDAATRNIVEIETDVKKWLDNADLIMREAKQVIEDEEKSKMRCSYAICLNLKQRHQQSKKAKKIVQDINEVLKNWRSDTVYMNFGSRMVTAKELTVALGDANFNMIGVWGMPGVGKSTLVRKVAEQVKEEKLFDEVAIATVTQSPNLIKIQGEIADKLDLKLDKETSSGRADLLRVRLTKDNNKKILVILDDVWEKLDLDEIGIPRTGCKVVVTSRSRDVLSSEMGTQKDFGLEVLLKEEAWCLFEKLLGDSLVDSNLRSKAIEVSTACAGLPLALVTVAKALKNKCFFEWEDALRQLRRPSPRNKKRMQEVIHSAIKLSYNHLESPELKSFFLFCAQNQGFSSIFYQDMLKKCFGLRLFHGISTLKEARDRTYTLVRSLKNSGLLLDDPDTSDQFRLHDLTRDVALVIAYETQNVLTMRDEGLVEWPDEDDMKMCTSISVFDRDIHELPDKLECPELRCLLVYAKDREGSFKISYTFFEGMRKLKVLDLTYMRLSSLPSSLKLLTNLRTLCLDQCVLGDIAMIGEMKNLEILSLIRSEFEQLPREIGLLTHLRMLDLSNCTKLQVIPANVLSRLTHLEELYVGNSFTQWEVEGVNNERASLAELKHLSRLSTLEVHIPDANMMPKDLLFEKLKRYKIFIGDVRDWSDKHENSRVLKLKLNTSNQLESGIKMLFNGIEDLCLDELNGVKSIVYELDMKGFQQLKQLHVQNNAEIKYIIHSRGLVIDDVVFPALKIFSLKKMINLEGICDAQLPLTSFRDIRIMKVEHCEKLKFVFSSSIAKGLSQLQELEIKECNVMRAIVVKEDGELEGRDVILFPQLRHLKLQCLPKLVSFLSTQNSIITDVGEIIHEGELDFQEIPHTGMQPLFNEEVAFPNLESLLISYMPNLKIIWHDKFAPGSFTKLQSMNVQFCESLMNIFQVNMLSRFQSLESLVVDNCGSLQEIFELDRQEVMETRAVTVTQLKKLFMCRLPKLKRVWNKDPQGTFSFPNLQEISVWECESLKSLFPTSVARCLKQLDDLQIVKCGIEEIIEQEEGAREDARFVFPKLTLLILRELSKLKWFYRGVHTLEWPLLKTLEVSRSNEIQIFASKNYRIQEQDEQSQLETSIQQPLFLVEEVVFPNLETLELSFIHSEEILLHNQHRATSSFKLTDPRFQNLRNLTVKCSGNLKYLLSSSTATFMVQLKSLDIEDCKVLEEVLLTDDLGEEEMIPKVLFPRLDVLILKDLPVLKRFCVGSNIKFPSLKVTVIEKCPKLFIFKPVSSDMTLSEELKEVNSEEISQTAMQPLFNEEVAFSNLEDICISDKDNLKMLWHNHQLVLDSFCKLKKLSVSRCKILINIFPPNMLRRLQNLEELKISDCNSVEEVFDIRGVNVDEICDMVSNKLRVLRLSNLSKLKHVWSSDLQAIVTFQNLHTIEVFKCKSLKSLFPVSVAKSLEQLKSLTIHDCGLEEIVAMEEGLEIVTKFVFPQLLSLNLFSLPELKCFYPGKHTSEWSSLKWLSISKCDKIKIFASNELSFPETDKLGHHVPVQQPLFLIEKVAFSNLENIYITAMDNLKMLWHNHQLAPDSLSKLKMLNVSSCKNLINIFPPNMLRRLQNLEELNISDCNSVEEVFDIRGVSVDEICDTVSTQLRVLRLFNLPKLKHVWSLDPQAIVTFQNLHEVVVSNCKSLKCLFSVSMAKNREQLESLTIGDCGLEEIVAMEGVETTIKFPRITSLHLEFLPKLKCFYPRKHTLEWPSLTSLRIYNCGKVNIIAPNELSFQERDELGHHVLVQRPLFPIEKDTLSNLEELKLDWDDTINQTYGRLKAQFSCKLKVLWLYSKDRWTAFPWVFVQGLYNLKELGISNFFLEELCPCGIVDNEGQYAEMFECLTTLHLSKMPKLMHLWKENSQRGRSIQNLESLYVSECGRLVILVPSSMYFQNLNTLEVSKCHGLISLATSSTVKSLVQLKTLTIYECKRMRGIVTSEGEGEAGDEICFNQLNFLRLSDLPTLRSFHLGNRTMKFPSLKYLYVTKCPELKIFSNGVLSMPKLYHVGLDGNYWWERQSDLFPVEDVNTFIKRCWEKNNDPCLRQLFTQKTNASTSEDGEENDVDDLEDNST